MLRRVVLAVKIVSSLSFGIFSVVVIAVGVYRGYSMASGSVTSHAPILAAAWMMLFISEGYQVAVLRIQDLDLRHDIIDKGFSRAAAVHQLIFPPHRDRRSPEPATEKSAMRRLLIGQSFFVVLCSFTIAQITTFNTFPAVPHLNSWMLALLFQSGLPGVFITVTLTQLLPSILGKKYPLRFLDMPGVLLAVRLALAVESLGVVQLLFPFVRALEKCCCSSASTVTGVTDSTTTHSSQTAIQMQMHATDTATNELRGALSEPQYSPIARAAQGEGGELGDDACDRSAVTFTSSSSSTAEWTPPPLLTANRSLSCYDRGVLMCDAIKLLVSVTMSAFSLFFIVFALLHSYSSFAAPVPVQILLLLLALSVIFYCEGLKIAIIKITARKPASSTVVPLSCQGVASAAVDRPTCDGTQGAVSEDRALVGIDRLIQGQGSVERFMLGRQLIVVPLGFLVAQITHFGRTPVWSDPVLYFVVVIVGLPGILTLLQFAQLTPQLLAEAHSEVFLQLPGGFLLVSCALAVEQLGITQITTVAVAAMEALCCKGVSKTSHNPTLNGHDNTFFHHQEDSEVREVELLSGQDGVCAV